MNKKRSQLQAYFAGIFDGEGHISITFNGTTWQGRCSLMMIDPQAVLLLWRMYPEAVVMYTNRNENRHPFWEIRLNQYHAYEFIKETLPFLLVKHEQALIYLSFISHRRAEHYKQHGMRGTSRCQRCEHLAKSLKAVRSRAKGVNSVNALLDHEMREYRAEPEEVAMDVAIMAAKMREILEGVETRLSESNKTMSAPEKDIVQTH